MAHSDLTKDWGYSEHNGPCKWKEAFPVATGVRQSPIDIETAKATHDAELSSNPLTVAYQPESNLLISNTGHSIQAQITQTSEISGGPLENKYKLEQFHMHWGSAAGQGSEHTIDGATFAAELHLVHYNEKYGKFANAVDKPDGLSVIGVMIKEGQAHKGLSSITDNAGSVLEKTTGPFNISGSFNPASLLPENIKDYWTYLGSLTTPPLFESVTWIVLRDPIEVSKEQLADLRKMKDCHGLVMQDNYRPPCPIEARVVRKSFN